MVKRSGVGPGGLELTWCYACNKRVTAHSVVFDSNTDEMTILERVQRSKTILMGYFEANSHYPEACSYLYVEFPEHFV